MGPAGGMPGPGPFYPGGGLGPGRGYGGGRGRRGCGGGGGWRWRSPSPVASGGTGKTLVAVNLALALAGEGIRVRLIDCDVEEPNDHLFLRPDIRSSERVELTVPRIDSEKCDLCRNCVDFCAFNALALAGTGSWSSTSSATPAGVAPSSAPGTR